jgi:epoxide hydrolase-like predicted phosphatase
VSVRALVFDVGGVLEVVDDDAWPELWVHRWAERAGMSPEDLDAALLRHDPGGSVATGEVTEEQLRRMYAAALDLGDEEAEQMTREMWDAYCGSLDVELRDFVASLRPGYRTAILSNSADGARREEQRRYGFEELVDLVVYSHEEGVAKPSPEIYERVTDRLAIRPDEVVFLDDVGENVEAAAALGWQAVQHRSTAESIRRITELLREP